MDSTDALEDWVAIKEHPFLEANPISRLEFLVAWNDVDWKIAITCREKSRTVSDEESNGWSKLLSLSELRSIHEQLALVHPSLGPLLPVLPDEPRGVWSYIVPPQPPSDDLCQQLTMYLKYTLDICGNTLLTSTMFEEHSCDEYFENISELRRRTFDEALARADDELQNVLFLRSGSINMLDMSEVYTLEDEALFKWNIALAELYNYLIQPFLDMREMAFDKLRYARNGLINPDLGKRCKDELAAMFTEWNENYTHALDRIQELYMEYYYKTVNMLTDVRNRMVEDKERFGQKTFEIAALERYTRTYEDFTLESLQLLNNTKCHYDNQREKVKQQIASLDSDSISQQLGPLEQEVYRWQRQVYDVQLQISQLEEQLIRIQLSAIKQQQAANDPEFYDAVETEEDLESLVQCQDPKLNARIKELQTKMATILKKRAQIRNRNKKCEAVKVAKKQKKIDKKESYKQHHNIQIKRENQSVDLEQKQDFIQEERRKTLQRLKEYNMKKHPAAPTIKPRKPLSTRKSSGKSGTPSQRRPSDHTDSPRTDDMTRRPFDGVKAVSGSPVSDQHVTSGCSFQQPPPPPPPPCPPPLLSVVTYSVSPPPPPPLPMTTTPKSTTGATSRSTSANPSDDTTVAISVIGIHDAMGKLKKVDQSSAEPAILKTSTPSEVISLQGIQNAMGKLKKVERAKPSFRSNTDPMSDMLQLIKQGVKLRPVHQDDVKDRSQVGSPKHIVPSSDCHTQQLMAAIQRISLRLHNDSDDEEMSSLFGDSD